MAFVGLAASRVPQAIGLLMSVFHVPSRVHEVTRFVVTAKSHMSTPSGSCLVSVNTGVIVSNASNVS